MQRHLVHNPMPAPTAAASVPRACLATPLSTPTTLVAVEPVYVGGQSLIAATPTTLTMVTFGVTTHPSGVTVLQYHTLQYWL